MKKPNYFFQELTCGFFRLTAALMMLFFPCPVFSGNELGNPFIRNYSPEEYKAHPQNWAICQDARGMIYVGNIYGLLEYDGKNWNLIEITNHSPVYSLVINEQNRLYIGGNNELGYLTCGPSGKSVYVSLKNKFKSQDKQFTAVYSCHATSQGIYFVTLEKIFRWHNGNMETIVFNSFPSSGLVADDRLLLVRNTGDIFEFIGNQPRPLAGTEELKTRKIAIHLLAPYRGKKFLIPTERNGFFIYDPDPGANEKKLREFPAPEITDYVRYHPIAKSLCLPKDRIALGCDDGVIIMDTDGKLLQHINNHRGLQDNKIVSLMLDREENLWAALNYGISRIEINSPISQFSALNGLEGIELVSARHRGRIYAGNFNGLFYLKDYQLNTRDDRQQFLPVKNVDSSCFALIVIGNVFLSIGGNSVFSVSDRQTFSIITGPAIHTACLSKKFPRHAFFGYANGIFAAEIIDPATGELPLAKNSPETLVKIFTGKSFQAIKGFIRKVVGDGNGDIWVSAEYDGIYFLKLNSKDIEDFQIFHFTEHHGLPGRPKNTVHIIGDQLLVGTEIGLYRGVFPPGKPMDPGKIRFEPETNIGKVFQSKPQRVVRIARDREGDYWMSLMNPGGFAISFRNNDGSYRFDDIPFREITGYIEHFHVEEDGVAWLAGVESRALFRFDKKIKKNYRRDFHTLIRQVACGKDTVIFSGNYYDPASRNRDLFRETSLKQPKQLRPSLPFRNNSLLFQYAAAFFESPEKTRFQYTLEGLTREWSAWSEKTDKEYGSLPEGNYCFKVKAKNIFDHESDVASFSFSISAPWYRTFWSYSIYAILFMLVMYGGIRLNTRRLQEAKKRLEKIVAERTAEVVRQRDEITAQKNEIETYAGELYSTNQKLKVARDALWGEMELAKKIQTVLLPDQPQIPGYEIAAYMKPADEVGGDYYDVINVDVGPRSIGAVHTGLPHHWIVIGDVSGHGVPAGLVMMMAQTSIRSILLTDPHLSVENMLVKMNIIIHDNIRKLGEEKYMTITLLSVQQDGTIYFSGLHQDMMIFRASRNEVELVETRGMWIGLLDNIGGMIGVDQLVLNPGDTLLLYTDGVTEATDAAGQLFSEEKLRQVLQDSGMQDPEGIKDAIIQSLTGYNCQDDVTLLILHRT